MDRFETIERMWDVLGETDTCPECGQTEPECGMHNELYLCNDCADSLLDELSEAVDALG
jgi:hypothetical protein